MQKILNFVEAVAHEYDMVLCKQISPDVEVFRIHRRTFCRSIFIELQSKKENIQAN